MLPKLLLIAACLYGIATDVTNATHTVLDGTTKITYAYNHARDEMTIVLEHVKPVVEGIERVEAAEKVAKLKSTSAGLRSCPSELIKSPMFGTCFHQK